VLPTSYVHLSQQFIIGGIEIFSGEGGAVDSFRVYNFQLIKTLWTIKARNKENIQRII